MDKEDIYQSPLSGRYASREMSFLFSDKYKYTTWRKLWIALAKAEHALGVPITEAQIQSMIRELHSLDLARVAEYEKVLQHDVMAHIHAYGDSCPEAKGIIHLGATSCFVTDNTDLIQMKEGIKLLKIKLLQLIRHLASFAQNHASLACLSYTHLQPAQPTTVGKRACMWLQDLLMDFHDIEEKGETLRFLGAKGATGTQASFLSLLNYDHSKVKRLEILIATEMGFTKTLPISGQTYTRKQDIRIFSCLSSLAATAHKMATDIRLLCHMGEVDEPFAEKQVGSSAMPYKRNPMRSERICSLARFLISLNENPLYTSATQWLERTLDDSANRRLSISEAFLCADALLNLLNHIFSGLIVYPKMIEQHLNEHLPFMATENILMHAVKKGKDRQFLHEALRKYTIAAARKWKEEGVKEDLLGMILLDPEFHLSQTEMDEIMKLENFIGRAPHQVQEFLHEEVSPILKRHENLPSFEPRIEV